MRVPEKFWEAHADGFESATGGDDDADGHGGGVVFLRGGLHQGWVVGGTAWQVPGAGLAVVGE